MKPLDYPLLADENVHPEVVNGLRGRSKNVRSVVEEGLTAASDSAVLQRAYEQGRAVLTHDADFGRLAVQRGQLFVGLLYLRPGHIAPAFTLESLAALDLADIEADPPFVVVVDRRGNQARVRLRARP